MLILPYDLIHVMENLRAVLDLEAYQKLVDANKTTLFEILITPLNELQQLTNLTSEEVELIKKKASGKFSEKQIQDRTIHFPIKLETFYSWSQEHFLADQVPPWDRFSTGCNIDSLLHGGIPINGITEVFGCSGVGKTQLCLQLALMIQLPSSLGGKEKDALYICTEDAFPSRRFHQLAESFKKKFKLDIDFESSVYLKHVTDFEQLRHCLCIHLPKLLRVKNIGLIVIDSIAGVFRSENENISYSNRGQDISNIAATLHSICDKFGIAIVCTNQVSENVAIEKNRAVLGIGVEQ
ncbi:hypothetical protein NQ317_017693 [Molorchus minor]|uniref:RecA family profile 1 domain-containing protein n=1 Tax=Molorchus minor TaxID=1323400 RepID=A0ABQ9JNC1_9CUCU|nr:hypothetical protein NQ317_017693 [Molorchus minor]